MSDKTEEPTTPVMEELQDQDLDQVNGGARPSKVDHVGKGDLKMGKPSLEDDFGDLGFTGKGRTNSDLLGYSENRKKIV